MAYLELSKEAYNDIILAAGMKGSKVARVCEAQGVWSEEAAAEAPVVIEERVPRTTYKPEPNEQVKSEETEEPGASDPIVEASDD